MQYILVAAVAFGGCFLIDKLFTRLFRGREQHKTGLAVRLSKRYALFGLMLAILGVMGLMVGLSGETMLLIGGIAALILGVVLIVYYLSFGIFYDADSFVLTTLGKKSRVYRFADITAQGLYIVQGGSVLIELILADGNAVTLQTNMEGTYPFIDHAFAAWCRQTEKNPEECDFHDPSQSLWFPMKEDM